MLGLVPLGSGTTADFFTVSFFKLYLHNFPLLNVLQSKYITLKKTQLYYIFKRRRLLALPPEANLWFCLCASPPLTPDLYPLSLLPANPAHSARPIPPGSLPWSPLASGLPSSHSAFCTTCMGHKCHVVLPKHAGTWLISPGSIRHLQRGSFVPDF